MGKSKTMWGRASPSSLLFLVILGTPAAHAANFECAHGCGMEQEGAYPHLVVGTVDGMASAQQSAALFQAMRKAKRWAALPPDREAFAQAVQPVSIRLPSGRSYTVLIAQNEAQAVPLHAGDFVRYAPHRSINEKPPTQAEALAYWRTTGCIALLCRAGDQACVAGFRGGLYRATDGVELAPGGLAALPGGSRIDPYSMRPR
jgi:hypothetical protein